MSEVILIKSKQNGAEVLSLVKSAIDAEVTRLELALEMAKKRLLYFEKKYKVTSDHFMSHFAAEDLEGGDEEYVMWSGEYQLKQRLAQKLTQLREIEYAPSDVFQPN